jgi:hypothetical protein
VSSYQKVGAFTVAGGAKQGGNVASYFCTPEGARVLHAVAGPAGAEAFLREARWAVEVYKLARLEAGADVGRLRAAVRRAHADRLRGPPLGAAQGQEARQRRVHRLLADYPLPGVEEVYRQVFEQVLGERVSNDPVRLVE